MPPFCFWQTMVFAQNDLAYFEVSFAFREPRLPTYCSILQDSQKAPMAHMAGQAQFAPCEKISVRSASEIPITERLAAAINIPMKAPTLASDERGFLFAEIANRSSGTNQVATPRTPALISIREADAGTKISQIRPSAVTISAAMAMGLMTSTRREASRTASGRVELPRRSQVVARSAQQVHQLSWGGAAIASPTRATAAAAARAAAPASMRRQPPANSSCLRRTVAASGCGRDCSPRG
jgi:hypothetical protein